MDNQNSCQNCISLNEQCLQLKHEIMLLNQKLDNLLNHVFQEKVDSFTQMDPPITNSKVSASTQTKQSQVMSSYSQTEGTDHHSDSLSEIVLESSKNSESTNGVEQMSNSNFSNDCGNVVPYLLVPDQPFAKFDMSKLDRDTIFDIKLANRSLCYYGILPYSYGSLKHSPKQLPTSGNYICQILSHLQEIFPDFKYNSVLITKYNDGKDCLAFHSDNEPEIEQQSTIATISLGQQRLIKFRQSGVSNLNNHTLFLRHGDMFLMSRDSQDTFEHSVPSNSSIHPRISITCRLLQPLPTTQPTFPINQLPNANLHSSGQTAQQKSSHQQIEEASNNKNISVFISSSMFRELNEDKLSSTHQQAKVFFFPGATAEGILTKIRKEPRFQQINPSKVKKVFLLCGTNNIDNILKVTRDNHNSMIGNLKFSEHLVNQVKLEVDQLVDFVHLWANEASINIINILPRVSLSRNIVINELNNHISQLASFQPYVNFISTELGRSLFCSRNGFRKNIYFNSRGTDNVHLNRKGVIRLAKHLKYCAHCN